MCRLSRYVEERGRETERERVGRVGGDNQEGQVR